MAKYLPILPRSGLWLFCPDCDGRRLARIFAEVWRRIPYPVRRLLRSFWRQTEEHYLRQKGELEHWPLVELVEHKRSFIGDGRKSGTLAQTRPKRGSISFRAGALGRASDSMVRYCVAHELAHVYCYAKNRDSVMKSKRREVCGVPIAESLAEDFAKEWGFERPD